MYYSVIQSHLCNVCIIWIKSGRGLKVRRIFLLGKKENILRKLKSFFPDIKQAKKAPFILRKINSYLGGAPYRLKLVSCQKELYSRFGWKVCLGLRKIPPGKVITYKALARRLGMKSQRAIGGALARNPLPIVMPCHRVVDSNKEIGGFQSGKSLKKRLLELEGVTFDKKGRIEKKFFIQGG